jgi:uncharacterized protein (TIGR02271 family)
MPTDPPLTSGPDVVLHQEQLHIGVSRVAVRAVLRRRITTEVRQVEVTVRREVLEVEHLPVEQDGDIAGAGQTRTPLVIVLSEEVPVVELRTRPYEQVTVDVETVTDQQPVSATVGRELADISTTSVPAP